jgi:hypothetical protein
MLQPMIALSDRHSREPQLASERLQMQSEAQNCIAARERVSLRDPGRQRRTCARAAKPGAGFPASDTVREAA